MMKVLVVAPHPDDEALGAGGTILRLIDFSGAEVAVCFLFDRKIGHVVNPDDVRRNQDEIVEAKRILKYRQSYIFHFEEEAGTRVAVSDLIPAIEKVADELKPSIVIGPFGYDLNREHRLVAEAVRVVFRPFMCPYLKAIMCYEIAGSTDLSMFRRFDPNCYMDISGYEDAKLTAVLRYRSEIRQGRHPRSEAGLRALMTKRGAEIGVESAEAFVSPFMRLSL